jgi:hypothetical protein
MDHINGIRSDNRLANLRECSPSQNGANRSGRRNTKAGLKGAIWNEHIGRWSASIEKNGVTKALGYFDNATDAHNAYRAAAAVIHGEFARFE